MNIHLIASEKFTAQFIDFIDKQYPRNSNIVYVYDGGAKFEINAASCSKNIKDLNEIDLSVLEDGGKLFVHAFYSKKILKFLFRNIRNIPKGRLVLIAWGADIYDAKFLLEDGKMHFKTRYYEYIKKKIIKHCDMFMTFACGDINIIKNYYGGIGKQFDCLYPSNADVEQLNILKRQNGSDKNLVRVLVGNSATETNQHVEALNMLAKFKEENIEILCPLSYGEPEYGKRIMIYGKNIFQEKFIPIVDYMSPENYAKLLNSVDVAVFNNNRQQGTGNIEILGYLGKKVFIRSDTTTWEHYVVRDGCCFFDTINMSNLSFDEFVKFELDGIHVNETYFSKIWDISYVKSLWDEVINF